MNKTLSRQQVRRPLCSSWLFHQCPIWIVRSPRAHSTGINYAINPWKIGPGHRVSGHASRDSQGRPIANKGISIWCNDANSIVLCDYLISAESQYRLPVVQCSATHCRHLSCSACLFPDAFTQLKYAKTPRSGNLAWTSSGKTSLKSTNPKSANRKNARSPTTKPSTFVGSERGSFMGVSLVICSIRQCFAFVD